MWRAEQNISQAGKRVFHKIPAFPVMSLTKILETFIRSFPSSFNRKYVHTVACTVVFVGPARFVCNGYPGRNATCPISSCSNKNDGHEVALTDFYPVSIKYGLRTADYGLRTGYKKWTRCKTRTGKHGLSIKHGQGIKRGLRTGYEIRTTDYFGKNDANWF